MDLSESAKEAIRGKLLREHRRLIGTRPLGPADDQSDYSATGDEADLAGRTAESLVREGTLVVLGRQLDGLGRAMEKLDEGTWGTCDQCGHGIPAECMEHNPAMNTHFRLDWKGVDRGKFDSCARACSDYGQPDMFVLKATKQIVAVSNGGPTAKRRSAVIP